MRAYFVLLLAVAAVSAAPRSSQRIVGGSVTTIDRHPDIVGLLSGSGNNFRQSCGGSILNNRSILTAAHCFMFVPSASRWRIRAGSTFANSGGQVINVNSIINHPSFSTRTLDNDVSVMRLSSNINLSNVPRAASIAGSNYNLRDNEVVWAAGWGHTSFGGVASEQLRQVQVWTVNQSVCRQRYAERGNTVTDNMLCAGWLDVGGRDACQGDSGGPLYHNGVVVGITSWGADCALARFPGVNVRVSRYTNWITSNA